MKALKLLIKINFSFIKNLCLVTGILLLLQPAHAFDLGACVIVSKSKQRSPAGSDLKHFEPGALAKVIKMQKGKMLVGRNSDWKNNSFSECAGTPRTSKFQHKTWIEKKRFEDIYLWDELKLENAKDKGTYSKVYKSKFLEVHFDNETLEATLFSYGNRTIFKGRPEVFQVFVTGLPDFPLMIRTAELDQAGTEIIYAGKNQTLAKDFSSQFNGNGTRTGGIRIEEISSKGIRYKSAWNCLERQFDISLKDGNLVTTNSKVHIKPKEAPTVQFRAPFQASTNYQAVPGDRVEVIGYDEAQDKVQVKIIPSAPKPDLSPEDLTTFMSYSQLFTHVSADYSCS